MAKEAQIVTRQAQTGQEIDSRIHVPVLEQKVRISRRACELQTKDKNKGAASSGSLLRS